ncbi:hypothetical protein ACOAPY_06590 [Pseudomonas sp. P3C3]
MDLKQACHEILDAIERNGLQKKEYNHQQLIEQIDPFLENIKLCEFWDILDFIYEISTLDALGIAIWDDCNEYQEVGFYKENLLKLSEISLGEIKFSEVEETWHNSGKLTILVKEESTTETIELNPLQSHDLTPEEFITYIKNKANQLQGNIRPLIIERGGFLAIYIMPAHLATELSNVRDAVKSHS